MSVRRTKGNLYAILAATLTIEAVSGSKEGFGAEPGTKEMRYPKIRGRKTDGIAQCVAAKDMTCNAGGISTVIGGIGNGESWWITARMATRSNNVVMMKMFLELERN